MDPQGRRGPIAATDDAQRWTERASAAYAAMQRHFARRRRGLLGETAPGDGRTAYLWPFSPAFAATLDLAGLPGAAERVHPDVADRLAGLARYWNRHGDPPAYDSTVRSWFAAPGDHVLHPVAASA